MIRRRVGILGGGISGVALAARLGEDVEVLEKAPRVGGLCATISEEGFTFDAAGPHIMFSRNREVLELMVEVLEGNVHRNRRENRIWFRDRLVKYPFENDLASLPKEDNFDCIYGYIVNPCAGDEPSNLAEWSYKTFGAGISEKYFLPYNAKIWNHDPAGLGLEFVARIPKPPMEDVLRSSIGIPTEGYLHQLYYFYPTEGGFEAVVHGFASRVRGQISTSWEVAAVERRADSWRVVSSSGQERSFETLVSTIPVHELLRVWKDAPAAAHEAAAKLRYNSLINVVVGSDRDPGHELTAVYVPDPEIVFHRLSFPKAFSGRSVPAGGYSVMAEITTGESDPLFEADEGELTERVIDQIARLGFVDPVSVTYRRVVRIRYGYPVYDLRYRQTVHALREAIAGTGLRLLGRFAQFDYINSDVCVERALALGAEIGNG